MAQIKHDPDARLDYTWDWIKWLRDEEIIVTFSIDINPTQPAEGIMLDASDIFVGGKQVVAWLRGGVVKTAVDVTCHIVTSDGREDDRTHELWVAER